LMRNPEMAEQPENQRVGLLPQKKRLVSLTAHVRQALPCARRLSISRVTRHELGRGAAAGIDGRQSTRPHQRHSVLPRPTRALPSAPHLHQNTPAGSNAPQSLIAYPTGSRAPRSTNPHDKTISTNLRSQIHLDRPPQRCGGVNLSPNLGANFREMVENRELV